MELRDQTALVTGGAHRVGKGISLALARAGCHVVLHYNSSAGPAEETAAEIEAMGRTAITVRADLSQAGAASSVVAAAGELAPVRVLVNNAAIFPEDSLTDVTPEAWQRTLDTNLTAPVFVTQAFAAALPLGDEGAVVNVTDWRAARPYPDHFSYTVAKGALGTFTLAAAEHLAPRIRVNAVALGAILPPPGKDSAYLKALAQEIPLQRIGSIDAVAGAVIHLLENDFVTGEIIRVDGGAHLR